jgi:hypothetical protein
MSTSTNVSTASKTKSKKQKKGFKLNLYAQTSSRFMDDVENAVKAEDDPDSVVKSLAEKDSTIPKTEDKKEEPASAKTPAAPKDESKEVK